eukprot:984067-Karenia_brevis.AAC.1
MAIKKKVIKASEAALWKQVADSHPDLANLRDGAWIQPARQVVLNGDPWCGGCARSVMVEGQWPRVRLYDQKYVDSNLCQ